MTSLYHIQSEHRAILDRLDYAMKDGDGLTDAELDQLNQDLEINAADFQEKAEAYAVTISEKRARAAYLKSEAARLTELAKTELNTADKLHDAISRAMIQQGWDKAQLEHFNLSFRASEAVEVHIPATDLPKEYQRMKIVYEADKDALKKAMKDAENPLKIQGVELVKRQNLQIK